MAELLRRDFQTVSGKSTGSLEKNQKEILCGCLSKPNTSLLGALLFSNRGGDFLTEKSPSRLYPGKDTCCPAGMLAPSVIPVTWGVQHGELQAQCSC